MIQRLLPFEEFDGIRMCGLGPVCHLPTMRHFQTMAIKTFACRFLILALLNLGGVNAQSHMTNDDDETLADVMQTTESEYINLSGQVPTHCFLWVDVAADAAAIDVREAGSRSVAKVQENCNAANGFHLSIKSINHGYMVHSVSGYALKYTIHYDQTPLDLAQPAGLARAKHRKDRLTNTQRDFEVKFNGHRQAPAGTYLDTVVLTVESNG